MFKHYLITRFNLRKADWQFTKSEKKVLTEEWMTDRMRLFEQFCFSSVKAQKNKAFEWWVYMDTTTDSKFRQRLDQLAAELPQLKLFYIDGMEAFVPSIQDRLASEITPYIITSRIDNDDAIREDFVDVVQSHFQQQDYCALDFVDGFALQIAPLVRLGLKRQSFNPFVSLIEKNEKAKSVWYRDHGSWKRETRLKPVLETRIWLQVVHFENKVNRFQAYGEVQAKETLQQFNLDCEVEAKLISGAVPRSKWRLSGYRMYIDSMFEYYFKKLKRQIGYYNEK